MAPVVVVRRMRALPFPIFPVALAPTKFSRCATISLSALEMCPTVLRASTVALLSRCEHKIDGAGRGVEIDRPVTVDTATVGGDTAGPRFDRQIAANAGYVDRSRDVVDVNCCGRRYGNFIADAAAVRAALVSGRDHDFVAFFVDIDVNQPQLGLACRRTS